MKIEITHNIWLNYLDALANDCKDIRVYFYKLNMDDEEAPRRLGVDVQYHDGYEYVVENIDYNFSQWLYGEGIDFDDFTLPKAWIHDAFERMVIKQKIKLQRMQNDWDHFINDHDYCDNLWIQY